MTSESNKGRPPASRAGAKPSNGNGRSKGNANQGDLWSDAPPKPTVPPREAIVEQRLTPEPPAPVTPVPSPPSDEDTDVNSVEALEPGELNDLNLEEALDEPTEQPIEAPSPPSNGRRTRASQVALPATEPEDSLEARPNLLETAPPLEPGVVPEFDDDYDEEEYEDDYGEGYYYRQDEMSLLRNPYVLAGLAVSLAIILAVAVVFLFGRGNEQGGGDNNGGSPNQTQAPRPTGVNAIPGAINVKSVATATVREGPGQEYLELGLLRASQDVQVVGRNQESTWYQIVYPRDSQLRGWVPKSALGVAEGDQAALAVVTVTPIERPTVVIPTSTPRPAEPTATPEATQSPNDRADIGVVIAADCAPNSTINLAINNVGNTPIDHNVQVIISNNGVVKYDEVFKARIAPGQSVPLATGVRAEAPSMTATVLLQGLQDVSAINNIASCQVSGTGGNTGGNNNNNGTNVPPPVGTPNN